MKNCLSAPWRGVHIFVLLIFALSACSSGYSGRTSSNHPGASPHYKIGKPYRVKGKLYYPAEDPDYEARGIASWYGRDFHGKRTANGERFDMNRLSAAHKTLPMPSLVEVTNVSNGRRIIVRVNDRGPFADNRIIDLSREAARQLGFERKGLSRVHVKFVGPAPLLAKAPRKNQRLVDSPPTAPLVKTSRATTRFALEETKIAANRAMPRNLAPTLPLPTSQATAPSAGISVSTPHVSLTPDTKLVAATPVSISSEPPPGPSAINSQPNDPTPKNQETKSSPNPIYLIRVAALSRLDNIEALKDQLKEIGQLRLSRIETASGSALYRINMGPFGSLETANKQLEAVRGAGYKDAGLITLTQ